MDTFVPSTQVQGAPPKIIVIDQGRLEEEKETPKEKDQEVIQTLVNLPTTGTPTRMPQKPSTKAIPLQILAPG